MSIETRTTSMHSIIIIIIIAIKIVSRFTFYIIKQERPYRKRFRCFSRIGKIVLIL